MSPAGWSRARLVAGGLVLAVVVWRLGTGPFIAGLRTVDATALLAGLGLGVLVTLCSAWRWSVVARGLGIPVSVRSGVAAYYRSQLLNTVLPGGVLGDVHRAVRHGRSVEDTPRAARAVVNERVAGQLVQVVIAAAVLLVLPSPVPEGASLGVLVLVAVALAARWLLRSRRPGGVRRWAAVTTASTLAVVGYVTTFLVAARTAGVAAPVSTLVPLALVVLVAMGIPLNVAGWGPREGVAAWVFAGVGLGADAGVSTAVVYGVMSLVAALPGLVVLLVDRPNRRPPVRPVAGPRPLEVVTGA